MGNEDVVDDAHCVSASGFCSAHRYRQFNRGWPVYLYSFLGHLSGKALVPEMIPRREFASHRPLDKDRLQRESAPFAGNTNYRI